MPLVQELVGFAGLGFFLVGLHLLSEVTRTLATRQVRRLLSRLSKVPLSGAFAGSLLGAVTQSSSVASFVCIGLLSSQSISLAYALSLTAWAGVGTSLLVFLAAVDLRLVAFSALTVVSLLYLASLNRGDAGRRITELLFAIGVTLLGLAMVKDSSHLLLGNPWVLEFFKFSSESAFYGFLIGLIVTLIIQSSSTVSIIVVAMSASGLILLKDAIILICGANVGSGLAVVLVTAHLSGQPRQLALWQALVKALGSITVATATLALFEPFSVEQNLAHLTTVPTIIAIAFFLINAVGAILASVLRKLLMQFIERVSAEDQSSQIFEIAYIIDDAIEDPDTAAALANLEQLRLISLLPDALAPLRLHEEDKTISLTNDQRHVLSKRLASRISEFIGEAIKRHPSDADVSQLLLLQRCNGHLVFLLDSIYNFVSEFGSLKDAGEQETSLARSMIESLHLILGLLGEEATGVGEDHDFLMRLTSDRSEVMSRYRSEIAKMDSSSALNREVMFAVTSLFERMIWLIRQIATDVGSTVTKADQEISPT